MPSEVDIGHSRHAPASGTDVNDASDSGVIRMSRDIYLKRPASQGDLGLHRMKMDVFRVTPAGGLFKSSIDTNISLFFPAEAVHQTMAISMQVLEGVTCTFCNHQNTLTRV